MIKTEKILLLTNRKNMIILNDKSCDKKKYRGTLCAERIWTVRISQSSFGNTSLSCRAEKDSGRLGRFAHVTVRGFETNKADKKKYFKRIFSKNSFIVGKLRWYRGYYRPLLFEQGAFSVPCDKKVRQPSSKAAGGLGGQAAAPTAPTHSL